MIQSQTVTATKTAVFQLRQPSARKRALLRDAMTRTHYATGAVIAALLAEIEPIREIAGKTARTAFMQKLAYAALSSWSLPAAGAAAARVDAMAMVESYLQKCALRPAAGPPTLQPLTGRRTAYASALTALAQSHAAPDREAELSSLIGRLSRPGKPLPFSLHGYRAFYQILKHPATGRYYAWINLLHRDSRFAPTQKEANAHAKEVAADMVEFTTGEGVRCKRPTWVLFSLAFGFGYQEQEFLLSGKPGGGRIVYRPEDDRFELHLSFKYERPRIDTGDRFLGMQRGIDHLAAWALTDADGRLYADGAIAGRDLRHVQRALEQRQRDGQRRGRVSVMQRWAYAHEAVHRTANELVALAVTHRAQLVMRQIPLKQPGKALSPWIRAGGTARAVQRLLGRQQYAKLVKVLGYKLARAGLPAPIEIGTAFTTQTCPECGHIGKENRPRRQEEGADTISISVFCCARCGYRADADCNAGRVIAIKGAWLLQLPTRKARGDRDLHDSEKFPHYLLDAIRRRGPGTGEPVVPS